MYGDTANKLILDAKRSANLSEIPLYQSNLINLIIKETNELNKDAQYLAELHQLKQEENSEELTEEDEKISQCQEFVTHLSMRRNKRCLLAYEKLRADKLVEFTWLNIDPISESDESNATTGTAAGTSTSGGGNSKTQNIPYSDSIYNNYTTKVALDNLSHAEQDFLKNYQDLLVDYKSNFPDIDLSGDLEPPTNIFIDVRVLKDGGEVQTEYGCFNLIKDSQFYVRKSDVERLIQQGYLEEI
ncbi:PSF1 [[Candida] subhashii]|uniref:DNA replication complex GINS protein PSF1 n=1 Tax=[Candida] subhashii TaxID=561895 RepID=A0A8J5QQS9_9ASCO|nr:PSF1 [[Candida] subhashii]KAG7664991.1 PSF1 [[Candida] subhashii]